MTFSALRHKYPTFYYKSFAYQISPQGLEIEFDFQTPPDLNFRPRLIIPGITRDQIERVGLAKVDAYVFHLGLVEMLSYWKATCSPEIVIEAGSLSPDQLDWWHVLLIKGMGEYFYVNQIDFTIPSFVQLTCPSSQVASPQPLQAAVQIPEALNSILIPIGGGKDSAVSIELLRPHADQQSIKLATLMINPTLASTKMAELSGIPNQDQHIVQRQMDPRLWELNEQGYLNGHTPFSALAAFVSVMVADLFGLAGVAVSNEHSSNEGNVVYQGEEINHQYSKTYEFEASFQRYCQSFFPHAPFYFSFLRPIFELQIAQLFASLTEPSHRHLIRTTFRSCNRGQKTNTWCGECSKCLFAYSILSPFIDQAELATMFGKNVLADESLWPIALELIDKGENKPLECVGTYEESLLAFYLSAKKIQSQVAQLPALLAKIKTEILNLETDLDQRTAALLQSWNTTHSLPADLANLLKPYIQPPVTSKTSVTTQTQVAPIAFQPVIDRLAQHHIVIFGLGREGLSTYRFVRQYLPTHPISLIDDQPLTQLDPQWTTFLNQDSALSYQSTHAVNNLPVNSVIVKTPGIPLTNPLLIQIRQTELPTTSNVQLFFDVVTQLKSNQKITVIGITGTKGKSTTTAAIHHLLQTAGQQTWLGGNIGVAALDLLKNTPTLDSSQPLFVVLELSCHQLDDLHTSPDVAVIQNIVPEHLDYYGSFERYVQAKSHITQFQTSDDSVIFNTDYEIPRQLAELSPGEKLLFATTKTKPDTSVSAWRQGSWLVLNGQKVIKVQDLPVLGDHNLENVLPAVVIGGKIGLPVAEIAAALKTFKPLPHRLELVTEKNGVKYVNDSLSTVPEAAMAALKAFPRQPVILIAGGYDRGQDFGELADYILQANVKALILFPATGEHIAAELRNRGGHSLPMYHVHTMRTAMEKANEMSKPGDVVLLSPASASFGGFKDYRDRGEQFSSLAME